MANEKKFKQEPPVTFHAICDQSIPGERPSFKLLTIWNGYSVGDYGFDPFSTEQEAMEIANSLGLKIRVCGTYSKIMEMAQEDYKKHRRKIAIVNAPIGVYSRPRECPDTLTVREIIDCLKKYPDETPVFFKTFCPPFGGEDIYVGVTHELFEQGWM